MSQLFESHGQNTGASDSTSALPGYIQGWFPLKWIGLISLLSSSVHFSRSVVSTFLRPPGQQYNRLPCPSPTPRICSNSCPLSQWCHLIISFSVIPFSSCLQSFPASGSFPSSSHKMAKVLKCQLQHQSFQGIFRTDFL